MKMIEGGQYAKKILHAKIEMSSYLFTIQSMAMLIESKLAAKAINDGRLPIFEGYSNL